MHCMEKVLPPAGALTCAQSVPAGAQGAIAFTGCAPPCTCTEHFAGAHTIPWRLVKWECLCASCPASAHTVLQVHKMFLHVCRLVLHVRSTVSTCSG
jgi:hypothetical protein